MFKSTDSLNSTFSNFKASNPTEMIAVLTAFKEKCVAQGKYLEAEKAKQKILLIDELSIIFQAAGVFTFPAAMLNSMT